MKKIYFVSNNPIKFKYFNSTVKVEGVEFEQMKVNTPEIQEANNHVISEYSAKWAAGEYNHPVIKEDVGVYINNLDGFPGPYLNYIETRIKSEGFLKLLEGFSDRSAFWEYAVAFCEPKMEPVSFYTIQKGSISTKVRGDSGFFMDKIFIPEGQTKTISELLDADEYVRNDGHYKQLEEYLKQINTK